MDNNYDIYSAKDIIDNEKEFTNIFEKWKKKNNIVLQDKIIKNDLINIENDFNQTFQEWMKNIKKKKIVYTAIIGNYDNLQEPKIITKNWEYICFTDTPYRFKSKYWKIVDIRYYEKLKNIKNNTLLARIIKWSPIYIFENIDFSIWVDANIVINVDLDIFINSLNKDVPIILTKHPNRNCIYQEIIAIKSRIERNIIKENINGVNKWCLDLKYKFKYPEMNGLCQTGLKIHNHKFKNNLIDISNFMRSIMNEYNIIRDQIIFNYICYYLKIYRIDLEPLPSIQNKNKNAYNFFLNSHI